MALNLTSLPQLGIPQANINSDITPQLSDLVKTINEGQKRQSLADLGKGLADGTLDYKQAAGKAAALGDLGTTMSLLKLGQEQQASKAFSNSISSLYGGTAQPTVAASPAVAGPVIPNDSNAFPGQAGMNARLADRSQDFIQDNPNTYLSSGVRSTADQARLYADRGNNPNPVAVPGTSNHERGMAVDIGGMTPEQRAMLPQYGLSQPVANDPPHVELAASSAPAIGAIGQGGPSREQIAALAANPATRPLAIDLLKAKMTGARFTQETDADGNIWNVNQTNGQKTVALKASDDKGPKVSEFYDENTGQPYKAVYDPEMKQYKRVGGMKAPSGMQITTNPDGTVSVTQGPVGKGGKLTEGQSKDMVFVTRASGALPIVDKLGDRLASLPQYAAAHMGGVGNYLKTKEYQQAEQAGREFLQAILRKDTGAAITKEETAEYGTVYLPQPGDSAPVLAQKKASRQRAVQAIKLGLPPQAILALESGGVSLPPNPQAATQPKGQNTTKSGISWSIE